MRKLFALAFVLMIGATFTIGCEKKMDKPVIEVKTDKPADMPAEKTAPVEKPADKPVEEKTP